MQARHGERYTLDDLLETRRASAIARRIGVSNATMSSWRRGHSEPSATNLQRLAEELGVNASQIDLTPTVRRAS